MGMKVIAFTLKMETVILLLHLKTHQLKKFHDMPKCSTERFIG